MPKGRRSILTSRRRAELNAKDAIYVITCGTSQCDCGRPDNRCERGFFSLFIQAVYGMDFAKRNRLPWHVDFGNREYCYSDHQTDNNFWNYYFEQAFPRLPGKARPVINDFYELYPIMIWEKDHLRKMNAHVRDLTIKDDVRLRLEAARTPLANHKVLGVHVRRTDHPDSVDPVPVDMYFHAIDKDIASFDRLFLSTDDARVVGQFRDRYGHKVHVNNVARSHGNTPVHRDFTRTYRRELGLQVLTDCLCLAACHKLVLTFSNVSYAALLFNPEIPYILLERPRTTWRRYKTLIVYFLDKWGIRKW